MHHFTLILSRAPTDDEFDPLYEAGCGDCSPQGEFLHFHRDAESLPAAVVSAVRDVEKVPGLEVVGVEKDIHVMIGDIAEYTGRSRESIRLLIDGRRGPGGFPAPLWRVAGGRGVWLWPDVAAWFRDALGEPLGGEHRELAIAQQLLTARRLLRTEKDTAKRAEMAQLLRLASSYS